MGVREVPGLRSQWALSPGGHPRALRLRPSVLPAVDMLGQVGALGKASAHRALGLVWGQLEVWRRCPLPLTLRVASSPQGLPRPVPSGSMGSTPQPTPDTVSQNPPATPALASGNGLPALSTGSPMSRPPGSLGKTPEPLLFAGRPPPALPGCRDPPWPLSEAICHQSCESPGRSCGNKLEMCRCSYQQKQHLPTQPPTMVGHLVCPLLPLAADNSSQYYIFPLN